MHARPAIFSQRRVEADGPLEALGSVMWKARGKFPAPGPPFFLGKRLLAPFYFPSEFSAALWLAQGLYKKNAGAKNFRSMVPCSFVRTSRGHAERGRQISTGAWFDPATLLPPLFIRPSPRVSVSSLALRTCSAPPGDPSISLCEGISPRIDARF